MELKTILLISSPIIATIIGFILKRKFGTRKPPNNKWRRIGRGNIPIWLIYRLYKKAFPTRESVGSGSTTIKGRFFMYKITYPKGRLLFEPNATIKDIIIHKKIRPDKLGD